MYKLQDYSSKVKILNYLIFLFPLAFILGNLAINSLVFLIGIIGLITYKKEIFQIKNNKTLMLVVSFFVYLLFISIYEDFKNPKNVEVIKSILYLRFLLFMLVIRCMVSNNEIQLKYFLILCLVFSTFVAFDVIIQQLIGKDLFGFEATAYHNSGIFNKERVAGGYISKFLFLGIFSIPLFFTSKNKKIYNLFFILIFLIGLTGILLSGNRMPSVMLVVFIFLMIIFLKNLRFVSSITLVLTILVFLISLTFDYQYKRYYRSFYGNLINMSSVFLDTTKKYVTEKINKRTSQASIFQEEANVGYEGEKWVWKFWSGHTVIYLTAIDIWNDRPILGSGIKSFRERCKIKKNLHNRVCTLHPHNYYLEILTDTGLIGFILFMGPIYFLLFKNLISRSREKFESHQGFFYSLLFILIIEFIPLKSSGSFFSTNSGAYIFLILGLVLSKNIKNFFRN